VGADTLRKSGESKSLRQVKRSRGSPPGRRGQKVQFHALLRLFYDDIREEPWTPSYAGGASRMDFFLREIGTAMETKMARPTLSARQLGDELIVDIERYSNYPGSEVSARRLDRIRSNPLLKGSADQEIAIGLI